MRRHTIKIDHDIFYITDDTKALEIEAAALTAIRQGGGMINLVHNAARNVTVLISPGVPVFFTTDTVDTEAHSANGSEVGDWVDLDVAFQDLDTKAPLPKNYPPDTAVESGTFSATEP